MNNVSAFCSDGCSTMMERNNSVASCFRKNFPGIIIVKCPSHSVHLCGQNAIKELPGDIVTMCSKIHSYFSRSPQWQHTLIEFQVYLDAEIQNILSPSSTRWLFLEACVARLIEKWDSLTLYFTDAYHLENIANAGPILEFFNSKADKCYLLFLNFILHKINIVNKFFQKIFHLMLIIWM